MQVGSVEALLTNVGNVYSFLAEYLAPKYAGYVFESTFNYFKKRDIEQAQDLYKSSEYTERLIIYYKELTDALIGFNQDLINEIIQRKPQPEN